MALYSPLEIGFERFDRNLLVEVSKRVNHRTLSVKDTNVRISELNRGGAKLCVAHPDYSDLLTPRSPARVRYSDPVLPRELVCKLVHGERRDQTDDAVWNACGCDDKIFPIDRNVGDRIREPIEAPTNPLDTALPAMVGKKACLKPHW